MSAAVVYGDPLVIWQRVLDRSVRAANGCLVFTGAPNSKGYGCICSGKKQRTVLVHRLAVLVRDGYLDPALTVDHLCHNADRACAGGPSCPHRRCVEPTHLDPVTMKVNVNRNGHGSESQCVRGHELSGANLYIHPHGDRPATRGCRACRDERFVEQLRRSA